jgi:hypothetical protein
MTNDESYRLHLLRMSVAAIKRQITDQLDGLDAEIAQLIPPRYQVQNHQKPTKDEMVNSIKKIINQKYHHHDRNFTLLKGRKQ